MGKTGKTAMIEPKCQRMADEMGFELVEVSLDREPTGQYLRIYIDKPEGITLDDCERYHKALRPLVEDYEYDFMEVSSPGIDRPLKKDRDFERSLGSEVEVRLFHPMDGLKAMQGILADFDRENLMIEIAGERKEIPRKAAALVKPIVDMEGIEDVDLGEDPEDASGQ